MKRSGTALARSVWCLVALAALASSAPGTSAQVIKGTLMDLHNDAPIDLGLVILFREGGDSVGFTVTNEEGYFELRAPDDGGYILLASALGYRETPAGVFDLVDGSEMTVEYRVRPQPVVLDEIVVALDRPVLQHSLVRNGFVRRLQRGLGHFMTPVAIERSPARRTEDLFFGINGVTVQPRSGANAFLGDVVQLRSPSGGWCTPTMFVDGIRIPYGPGDIESLGSIVPRAAVAAVEVYRRPSEVPLEYGITQGRIATSNNDVANVCGVIVFWTNLR